MGAFVLRNGADSALRDGDALRASTINSVSATFLARTQLTAIGGAVVVFSATFLARTSLVPSGWVSSRNIPELHVLIGFQADPLDALADVVWTDVTADALEFKTSRGRQHELSRIEPGTLALTLNNRHRRYDPTNTASPYSPNVDVLRRVQVRATVASTTYHLFTGYITDWGLEWPHQTAAEVEVAAVDVLGILNLFPLGDAGYDTAVLADSPTGYWRLGDTDTIATDSSSSANHGTWVGGTAPHGAGLLAGDSSRGLDGTKGYVTIPSVPAIEGTGAWSMEWWLSCPTPPNQDIYNPPTATDSTYIVHTAGEPPFNRYVILYLIGTAGVSGVSSSVTLVIKGATTNALIVGGTDSFFRMFDGEPHHLVLTRSTDGGTYTWYFDGQFATSKTAAAVGAPGSLKNWVGGIDPPGLQSTSVYRVARFPGSIDELAVYPSVLSAARVLVHYNLGSNPWDGDSSGVRLGNVLDVIGVPAADRAIDTGTVVLRSLSGVVDDALPHMQKVEEAEDGRLFVAGDGKVTFHGRHRALVTDTATTATFGDGSGQTSYLPGPTPVLDDSDLWTTVEVTPEGQLTQTSTDAAARTRYGKRTLSRSGTLHRNTNDAKAMADWLLAHYKAPKVRIRSLKFQPSTDTSSYSTLLGGELADRVVVERQVVPGGGPVFTQPSHIERVEHTVNAEAATWQTSFALSTADAIEGWGVLGTSTLGGTLRLAY